MSTKIFVNLPVKNLEKSKAFYGAMGYSFDPRFTNEQGACMVISEDIYAMLLVESFFKTFTPKPVSDAHASTEVLVCLQVESRDQVTALVDKAIEAGGSAYKEPQDHGFMYGHGFQDLDGHLWEIIYMDTAPPTT